VYGIGVDGPIRQNFFDLSDTNLSTFREIRVKISSRLPKNKVSCLVSFPGFYQSEVSYN
jgi:hypothetical protein